MSETGKAEKIVESLARDMLARNNSIKHEWRPVASHWWGDHLDLVCNPETANEVWATIRDGQIAVGDRESHHDFGCRASRSLAAELGS